MLTIDRLDRRAHAVLASEGHGKGGLYDRARVAKPHCDAARAALHVGWLLGALIEATSPRGAGRRRERRATGPAGRCTGGAAECRGGPPFCPGVDP